MVQISSSNLPNKQQQQQSSKYFLFYHQLPERLTKEIIQLFIKPHLIHHENPQVFLDSKENCFEIILNSKENQQKLLSTPIRFAGEKIHASLRSNKLCKHIPCTNQQTCFFSHSAVLPFPLFSENVRSWAFNFWKSKIAHLLIPDDAKNIIPPAAFAANFTPPCSSSSSTLSSSFGIEVPSEFYQQVMDYPLFYDFIPSVHSRLAFREIKKHLPDHDSDSYYIYNWDGTLFILSHFSHQIKPIKRVVCNLLQSSSETSHLENHQNHSNSYKKTKKNKKNIPSPAPLPLPPVQYTNKTHKKRTRKTQIKESDVTEIVSQSGHQSGHHQPFPPSTPHQSGHHQPFPPSAPHQSGHYQAFVPEKAVPQNHNFSLQPSYAPAPATLLPSQNAAQPQVFSGQNVIQQGNYAFQQQNYAAYQGYYPPQFPIQTQVTQLQGQYPYHYPIQQQYPQHIHPVHDNVQQQQGINYLPVQISPPQCNNIYAAQVQYNPNTFAGNAK